MDTNLLEALENKETDAALSFLVESLGELLPCERCALFLRNPDNGLSKMTHLWNSRPEHPLSRSDDWVAESPTLARDDPMFGEALVNPIALYIDYIEAEPADRVNLEFEREHFAHSALIHAPLHFQGQMVGILEPCVFDKPRHWSDDNKKLIAEIQEKIAPMCAEYVRTHAK